MKKRSNQHSVLSAVQRPNWNNFLYKRLAAVGFTSLLSGSGLVAQNLTNQMNLATNEIHVETNAPVRLKTIVVTGRNDDLLGIANSATEGTVGMKELAARPILRPGELLETVPGVVITQHSGSGKANQYFLRGFNLDHGTDLATSIDGVPINLRTHAHGQGYSDLNFMIPELVQGVTYKKGVYYADEGDFASAGAVNIQYANVLSSNIAQIEGGSFNYFRGLVAGSSKIDGGNLLYGLELFHDDGPWEHGDDYKKANGVVRFSTGNADHGFGVTVMGYSGEWNSTDQIAQRAVTRGNVSRFGALDPSDGGHSQRYSLMGEWHEHGDNSATKVIAYGTYYDLSLFSNFTYFKDDPLNGDQFEQTDKRYVSGLQASHEILSEWRGRDVVNTFGLQIRDDAIQNGLFHTKNQEMLSVTRQDHVQELSTALYYENRIKWSDKFRSTAGLRGDYYAFDVDSSNPMNSGNRHSFIASPKLSLVFGPWAKTEFYLNGGYGFHSNDGRGTTVHVDPATGASVNPANPLVRIRGADAGIRTGIIPNLQSTLSFWMLDIDSELVFSGDAGNTQASRPSRRVGLELANFYAPAKWLTLDADLAISRARFTQDDPVGKYIPGSIESVFSAGISIQELHRFFGSLRLRYFGPRTLIEDNSVRSAASTLLNARLGYQFNKNWNVAVEVFNILNSRANDIEYYYPSRLRNEAIGPDDGGYNDIHFHPSEPRSFRVSLMANF